jgi:hypothetical protein
MSFQTPGESAELPWQERERLGFFTAFADTVKLFVSAPREAWRRTRESGGYGEPLLFAVLAGWAAVLVSTLYDILLPSPWKNLLPAEFAGREAAGPRGFGAAGFAVVAPLFLAAALYAVAAVLHASFWVVGALRGSASGFEGTFRIVCYSMVSEVANVVPYVGWVAALVWGFYLQVKGAERLHRTTAGRATAALVLPLAILIVLLLLVLAGLFFAMSHSRF